MKSVSKNKIASVYATALYEAAVETGSLAAVAADVEELKKNAAADPELERFLANPLYSADEKRSLLKEVAAKLKWNPDTLRCMDIIAQNNRFKELALILDAFGHIYLRRLGIAEVEVETVKELSAAQDKKLKENLERRLQKKVTVTYKMVHEIIGGLKIRFGSEMIDNTLVSKLNRLENMMKGE